MSAPQLNAMDEVLLNDRFAAALAEAPIVSCAVPLPPTMPSVKLSKTGLPIPVPKMSDGPLFGPAMRPEVTGARPASADIGSSKKKKKKGESSAGDAPASEDAELHTISMSVHELERQYNKLRTEAAQRESQLEALQVQAQLGARDTLDADDELAYLRALKGAAEAELAAVAFRAHGEDCDQMQYDFMRTRVTESVYEKKTKV